MLGGSTGQMAAGRCIQTYSQSLLEGVWGVVIIIASNRSHLPSAMCINFKH